MPAYRYRAVHEAGRITRGVAAAANEQDLAHILGRSGLELIEARERNATPRRLHFARSAPPRRVAAFCVQMTDLLQAGVPFVDALRDVGDGTATPVLRDALVAIARSISHGQGIAPSFAAHVGHFPPVFLAILAAGERTGDMTRTFERLALYMENRARFGERLRRAVRYPSFLLAVTAGVFTFMLTTVVPQIILFLETIDGALPFSTRLLIGVSDIFSRTWWMALLALALGALLALGLRQAVEGAARAIDGAILRIPIIGPVIAKIVLARFAQSFAILFQSGLGVPESLRGARATLGNRALECALDKASRRVEAGAPLSAALADLFPPATARVLRIGEQGGRLEKSLNDIAATYDREATEAVDQMVGALEPALTLLVGALLAWIVMAVLGPIYGNLSHMNTMGR